MERAEEQRLVRQALEGSTIAFEALVRAHQDGLLRFLLMRGHARADAEDAAQNAFLKAWMALAGYKPRYRFSTWLYTIALRSAPKPAPDAMGDAEPPDVAHSPLSRLLRETVWQTAHEELGAEAFQALWLHYAEGFTGPEIARILGRTRVWVKVSLHRSRQRLQARLADTETRHESITA